MISTKYLTAALLGAFLLTVIGTLSAWDDPSIAERPMEAQFATPRESYKVAPTSSQDWSERRATFISKVRSELLRDLSRETVRPAPVAPVAYESESNLGDALLDAAGTSTAVNDFEKGF